MVLTQKVCNQNTIEYLSTLFATPVHGKLSQQLHLFTRASPASIETLGVVFG